MRIFKNAVWGFILGILLCITCDAADIHKAAADGNLEKVKSLIRNKPELVDQKDESGRTPLHLACYGGHGEVVKLLLKNGANTEARHTNGSTPLFWAIPKGHLEIVKLLLAGGANVKAKETDGASLLHAAALSGHKGIVGLLLDKGLNPNCKQNGGYNPLTYAVSRGHQDVVKLLITRGADVNIQEDRGYSPLYVAAFRGNLELLKLLIAKGANPDLKNSLGTAPLHDMAVLGKKEIVSFLITSGADVKIKDNSGNTPLQMAANHGQKDVVELLCRKGASLNRQTGSGDTPLHGAVWKGDSGTVEYLISHGAAINLKNKSGHTPLDNARLRGFKEIETLLLKNNGKGRRELIMKPKNILTGQIHQPGMDTTLKFTILYDNYLSAEGTKPDWGFSCLIEGAGKVILFDTGTRPEILLHNVNHLKVDLKRVQQIVISHEHHDHIGGLASVLDRNHDVTVYLPDSFAYEIVRNVEHKKAGVVSIAKPAEICPHVYSTGEMGDRIKEQSLIINTKKGLIIVTGCSHQGIVNILKRAKELFSRPIYLVFGGYHLGGKSESEVKNIIKNFRDLGVIKCGATHCTGDRAIRMFKKAYGENYVPMGTGRILEIRQ